MASESGTRTPTGSDPSTGRTVSTAFTVKVRLGSSQRATLATVTGSVRVISDASCCASVSIPHRPGLGAIFVTSLLSGVLEAHDGPQAAAGGLVSGLPREDLLVLLPGSVRQTHPRVQVSELDPQIVVRRLQADRSLRRRGRFPKQPEPHEGLGDGLAGVPQSSWGEPSRRLVLADRVRELPERLESPRQLEVRLGVVRHGLHRLAPEREHAGRVTPPGQERRQAVPILA